jgi:Fe/S biogenesis protein NfuA
MIIVNDSAQQHFRRLLDQQGIPGLGIRVRVVHPGTPKADCQIEFCESTDLNGDEMALNCADFVLYIDAAGAPFLDAAEIDYQTNSTGGQLTIRAPKIKGSVPGAEASLSERVRYLLDTEINPQVAAHGGRVSLIEVSDGNVVVLQFGGGCHGCGMVDVTLKQGIERTLRTHLPEIAEVRDATDHASGNAPYFRGKDGASPLR